MCKAPQGAFVLCFAANICECTWILREGTPAGVKAEQRSYSHVNHSPRMISILKNLKLLLLQAEMVLSSARSLAAMFRQCTLSAFAR